MSDTITRTTSIPCTYAATINTYSPYKYTSFPLLITATIDASLFRGVVYELSLSADQIDTYFPGLSSITKIELEFWTYYSNESDLPIKSLYIRGFDSQPSVDSGLTVSNYLRLGTNDWGTVTIDDNNKTRQLVTIGTSGDDACEDFHS